MVAYKKFTKAEREGVVHAMTKNVIEKEYKPIMSNVENELTSLFMKDIPNDVFEFEKKSILILLIRVMCHYMDMIS